MTVRDIQQFLERWAPTWTAWEKDNVGLQVGDPRQEARHILVALDVTRPVVQEALRRKASLIISHHPLLFRPTKAVRTDDPMGAIIHLLAQHKVALLSAHTNLDFAQGGVSFALAARLGVTNVRFLSHLQDHLAKLVVFVPESHVEQVSAAMADAGAGVIGQYSECSFRTVGTGTFRGSAQARPHVGKSLRLEHVSEVRLEMIAPRADSGRVIAAMKAVHPYEEVAYDVYDVRSMVPHAGEGVIGDLTRPTSLASFLGHVKKALRSRMVRFTGGANQTVQRVALCGGAGSALLETAISAGADAFVTADIRYHAFHDAHGRIALIDAGHYETEHVILQPLAERLRAFARAQGDRLTVSVTRQQTNPVQIV